MARIMYGRHSDQQRARSYLALAVLIACTSRWPQEFVSTFITTSGLRRWSGWWVPPATTNSPLGGRTGRVRSAGNINAATNLLARPAAPQIPFDELAPDEAPLVNSIQEVLPRLPEPLDNALGIILRIVPVVALASWVFLGVSTYEASKEAKEKDEKRKLAKAIKVDPKWEENMRKEEERERRRKKRLRRKPTALEESMVLDAEIEERE